MVVEKMSMRQAHPKLFYDAVKLLQYVAQILNLLDPYDVIYVDTSNWIRDDSLFDDPLHMSAAGEVQVRQRLDIPLNSDTASLSKHSAMASWHWSYRP
jgi:hypothetical protein